MVKKYSIITVFSLIAAGALCNPMSASAFGHTAVTDAGKSFTVGTTSTLDFQPSPQVVMNGLSNANAFVVAAVHTGAFTKANGEAYLMSSDASGLFSKVAGASDLPSVPAIPAAAKDGAVGGYSLIPGSSGS